MKIEFCLVWKKTGASGRRAFKSEPAANLFGEYASRISKFASCDIKVLSGIQPRGKTASALWICDGGPGAKMLSSGELARVLARIRDSGIRELKLYVGGPDGFSPEEVRDCRPDLIWSFGPLTLPHELAAVVCAEQIYRAWTVLAGMPYHSGH